MYVKIGNDIKKVVLASNRVTDITTVPNDMTAYNYIVSIIESLGYSVDVNTSLASVKAINIRVTYSSVSVTLDDVVTDSLSLMFPSTGKPLQDAPYKMFAIPYGKALIPSFGSLTNLTLNEEAVMNIVTQIGKNFTSEKLIDVQLLPFCPIQDRISRASIIDTTGMVEDQDYIEEDN